MPYIIPAHRDIIDKLINDLIITLKTRWDIPVRDGAVNYTITRLLDGLYPPGYRSFNAAIGVLSAVQLEYYRRVVAPYEDEKIVENGDVYANLSDK